MKKNINKEIDRIKNLLFESKENVIIEHSEENYFFPSYNIIFKNSNNNVIGLTKYSNFRVARLYDDSLKNFIAEKNDSYLKYKNIDEYAYFFDFEINENFRRLGYGKKMLSNLIDECKKKGFKKIFFSVNIDNINALNLYEKFNYHKIYENKNEILGAFFT